MSFIWLSEQTTIISLYKIDQVVFVMVKPFVFIAVRTEFLNNI
jgi:hypothetical protein